MKKRPLIPEMVSSSFFISPDFPFLCRLNTITLFSLFKPHYRANFSLAFPVILSQAGQMSVVMADTIMVGQLGEVPLAAVSLASNLSVIILFLGMGISFSITPAVGKSFGMRDSGHIAFLLRQARSVGWLTGFVLIALMGLMYMVIPLMGQPAEVVALTQPYFVVVALTMLPSQIFAVNKQFAEGVANTSVAMKITITGNVVNIVLNYAFIFGKLGCPAMGMIGAAYATLIAKVLMATLMELSIRNLSLFADYHRIAKKHKFSWHEVKQMVLQGLPVGGQMVVEVVAFSAGAVMMGWIGTTALAAHQVVMSMVSFTYMISAGLASATTIKVSIFRGEKRFDQLRLSAWASVQMVLVFMLFTGMVFIAGRHLLPLLFIQNAEVVHVAAQLMLIGGLFQLFDGLQVVSLGILRGMGDFVFPAMTAGIAYILVSLPVGYLLSIGMNLGPQGIWYGYLMGLAVAGLLLVFRIKKHFRTELFQI